MTSCTANATAASLYFYYHDNAGNLDQPAAVHHRHRPFQEDEPGTALRVAGGQAVPGDRRRLLPAPDELIHQDYQVDNLVRLLSVNGLPGTLWLTQQNRVDKDYALFGEASFDVTPQITLTAGGRWYKFDNTPDRFLRLRPEPGRRRPGAILGISAATPRAATGPASRHCLTASGDALYDRDTDTYATDRTLLPPRSAGSPCTNLGDFVNGTSCPSGARTTASSIA